MAGYSGTPLPKKLGIKPGHRVALVHAPDGYPGALGVLPDGVVLQAGLRGPKLDVITCFVDAEAKLANQFARLKERLAFDGGLWIAWPKKASGVTTDLNENVVRTLGLATGLVDNKVCAIDDTWSGLRFVYRLVDRPQSKRTPKR